MSQSDKIKETVSAYSDTLEGLDKQFMGEAIGVHQAIGDIRKALDEIETKMSGREYEQAAQLGYGDISSAFIFLQRVLGGLQDVANTKHSLISEIALKSGVPIYEEVEPYVSAALSTSKANLKS